MHVFTRRSTKSMCPYVVADRRKPAFDDVTARNAGLSHAQLN